VQHESTSFLGLIRKALRANYDEVAKEPLPERWVDLINHLNERELEQEREPDRKETPERARRH
jgi:hypothetical protein